MKQDPLAVQEQFRREWGITGPVSFGPPAPSRRDKFFSLLSLMFLRHMPGAIQRIAALF